MSSMESIVPTATAPTIIVPAMSTPMTHQPSSYVVQQQQPQPGLYFPNTQPHQHAMMMQPQMIQHPSMMQMQPSLHPNGNGYFKTQEVPFWVFPMVAFVITVLGLMQKPGKYFAHIETKKDGEKKKHYMWKRIGLVAFGVALLIMIVPIVFSFFQKRRYIKQWENTQLRQQQMIHNTYRM